MFNDLYGFGLLDADSLTEKARSWNLVPFQHICKSDKMVVNRSTNKSVTSSIKSNSCSATEYDEVNFLEHVEIEVAFSATKHGAVEMDLTSPSGTTSHMLTLRQHDTHSGDKTWRFMSVHFWGENPKGQWTMKMSTPVYSESGKLYNWQLILYGTKYNPAFGRQHEDKQRIEVATSTTGRRSRKSDTTKEKNGICQNTALCVIVIIVVILFGSIVIFAIRYLIIKQKNINKVKQETKLEHSKQTNISEECIRF
ncbi:proprotein convertase subtilisin/kexin type 6-like [Mizuhopecten yessoensis]|uniref:proprotein convertase subtilisin/kexin type 6-like n=1 Tax=Mizuhopecten yessoensis TaxID=6573 RepID=UPI000B45E2E7|nr:proprotein convertase subtilisin/kexin type 6-like [Mizuhopecten yessoensis]